MTFKFDSYVIPDSALKLMSFPDHVWVSLTASDLNTAGIFVGDSQANVEAGNKRAKLSPGIGIPLKANSDDELWVMAEDGSEPELIVACADELGAITGGSLASGIVTPVPAIAGHWGATSEPQVNELQVTGISANAANTYFVAIANEDDRSTSGMKSTDKLGLTWTKVAESHNSADVRTSIWRGTGTPSGSTLTAQFTPTSGSGSSTAMMVFAVKNLGATPVIGSNIKNGSGSSPNVSTATTTENNGMFLEIVGEDNNRTYTPGAGGNLVASYGVGTAVAIHVAQHSPTVAGTKTFTASMSGSADWAAIALALRGA